MSPWKTFIDTGDAIIINQALEFRSKNQVRSQLWMCRSLGSWGWHLLYRWGTFLDEKSFFLPAQVLNVPSLGSRQQTFNTKTAADADLVSSIRTNCDEETIHKFPLTVANSQDSVGKWIGKRSLVTFGLRQGSFCSRSQWELLKP